MEEQTSKKVSIIIPCYNQGKYIGEAIESALNQTYENIEIVCVNDGSTDNSADVIKSYADKYDNINFINFIENKGVINARNTAIESADGEYILPLDADDKIDKTYVEKAVKVLNSNPNIGIVYCKVEFFGAKTGEWKLSNFDKTGFLFGNSIVCTALFRKSDFIKAGGYKEYMSCGCEDYDLWLSFIEIGLEVRRIDEILFSYRQYETGSRNITSTANIEDCRKILIKKHIDLYYDLLFSSKKFGYEKKIKKYRKLFQLLLPISIVEFCLIIMFLALYGRIFHA